MKRMAKYRNVLVVLSAIGFWAGPAASQTFTTIDDPLGTKGSFPGGISGDNIVGSYSDSSNKLHGFLYNGSTWTTIDDPLVGNGEYQGTTPNGISGNNIVGGYADSSNVSHGFLYNGSTYTTLDDPLGVTLAYGISGNNIVGTSGSHGFLYNELTKTYTTLDDPLAGISGTVALGISDNNIVGSYFDSSGAVHGFEATVSEPSTLWASAASGSWSNSGNWTNGVPNAASAGAVINASTTAALTITLDKPQTVGTLQFGNSGNTSLGYTLSGTGSNTLTFSNTSNNAATTISVTNGSHAIDAPVILAENLLVSGSGNLAFGNSSSITGSYSLTMSGTGGTLIFSGTDSYSGGTNVNAGMLIVTSSTALPSGSSLIVGAGGTFIFDPSMAASPVMVSSGAAAVPEPSTSFLLGIGAVGLVAYGWRRRRWHLRQRCERARSPLLRSR